MVTGINGFDFVITEYDTETLLFEPKPGFTCEDWPNAKELSWFSKLKFWHHDRFDLYRIFDTVCITYLLVERNWITDLPEGENISVGTLRGKTSSNK